MNYVDISTTKQVNTNVYVNELLMARIEELENELKHLKVDNISKANAVERLQKALEEAFDTNTINWN